MASRGNQRRGPNRNSEISQHGEELAAWKEIKDQLPGLVDMFNQSSENTLAMHEQDKLCAAKKKQGTLTSEDLDKLDQLSRVGVKLNEAAALSFKDKIEKLRVLRVIAKHNEEAQEASTSRLGAPRRDPWDLPDDSPMPSPNPSVPRRMGGGGGSNSGKGDRGDSVPPKFPDRSTPAAKAGSAEPQPGPASGAMRAKQIFAKDDEVAFKPRPAGNEQTDWILGIVQEVRGEGKSRRYRVLDADFDENQNHHQKDFRTSASSMILIPREGTVLPPLEEGKVVLALYPNTTTFYKAEVMGMEGSEKVNLKFEGEESSNTMQAVTRRHVVEYRA
ncbi:putative SAGA-associated factor 29 [Rosellinia necatrix]|uniref:Putative SAGA-associated factor 29 n=1 Tax=Rosellinia necatrix TaxID=77044 RepID=A0A1W2TRT0_ROSNE|nr:putative SAGA-associated factor 29 [Rosellinia necatrix]